MDSNEGRSVLADASVCVRVYVCVRAVEVAGGRTRATW